MDFGRGLAGKPAPTPTRFAQDWQSCGSGLGREAPASVIERQQRSLRVHLTVKDAIP